MKASQQSAWDAAAARLNKAFDRFFNTRADVRVASSELVRARRQLPSARCLSRHRASTSADHHLGRVESSLSSVCSVRRRREARSALRRILPNTSPCASLRGYSWARRGGRCLPAAACGSRSRASQSRWSLPDKTVGRQSTSEEMAGDARHRSIVVSESPCRSASRVGCS